MSDYYAGFFVVPAASLDAMHRIEEEADRAFDAWRPDRSWRLGLVFQQAAEVAVASEVVEGPCIPLSNDERNHAYSRTRLWLMTRFLDENPRAVLDPEQFDILLRGFDRTSLDEFLAWNAEHGSKRYHEVAPERLVELYEALGRTLHARPPGPHGFVYADLWEVDRHPPEPPPEPPESTMSPADSRKRAQLQQFRIQAVINRQRSPWWVEAPHEEGRVLLGLLAPDQVDELADGYRRAMELFTGDEVLAGQAALNDEVIPRVEAALLEPVIETVGGRVEALCCLQAHLRWETRKDPPAICSPDQAIALDQLLDQHLDDDAIEWIHGEQRHWPRTLVRDTCREFREVLEHAIATGHGFVWLIDEYRT